MNQNIILIAWFLSTIIFTLIEIFTLGLATIWFAIGSALSLIAALFGLSFPIQLSIFFVSSLLLLAFTRPIVQNYLKVGKTKTNIDQIIDSIGIVEENIEPFKTGLVKVRGQLWTAVSSDNQRILKNTEVIVVNIEGVKLIVKPKKEE